MLPGYIVGPHNQIPFQTGRELLFRCCRSSPNGYFLFLLTIHSAYDYNGRTTKAQTMQQGAHVLKLFYSVCCFPGSQGRCSRTACWRPRISCACRHCMHCSLPGSPATAPFKVVRPRKGVGLQASWVRLCAHYSGHLEYVTDVS
jgi:hypothetical protein